jgi:hypothetical protein
LTGGTYGYGLFRAHYAAPGSGAVTVRPLLLSESPSNAYEWSEIGQLAAGERVVMFASNTGGMHKALKVIDDGGFVQTIVEANDPSVQIPGYPGYVFYDIYDADINTEGEVAFWARITKPSSPAYVGVFVTQFCGGGCADWKRGDANCDGTVSMGDINPFVLAVSNRAAWEAQYTCPYECANDINRDGVVDSGDINPFVQCISGQCPD